MIVSITGLIGSGKDTLAEHLVTKYNFVQLSFAESVKDALAVIFNWDRQMLEGKTPEDRNRRNEVDVWWADKLGIPNFTPRYALTTFGTDIMRKYFDDRIWILSLMDKITRLQQKNPDVNIVISDARYVNELNMLKDLGAITFNVRRGETPNWWYTALIYNQFTNKLDKFLYRFYLKYISKEYNIFRNNIHSSEYDWIGYNFDYLLFNNDTIEKLKTSIDMPILLQMDIKKAKE